MLPTVLIVNATPGVVEFLREGWGDHCHFVLAENAIDVYEHLEYGDVDAIVTDFDLPCVTAIDLVRSLRDKTGARNLPVAVFARTDDPTIDSRCREAGISLLVSPSTPKTRVVDWFAGLLEECELASEPPTLDVDMASAIANGTKEVLSALLGVEPRHGEVRVEKQRLRTADIIGSISLSGIVDGSATLFMSTRLARVIAIMMMGESKQGPETEEVVDAIGELTNMVAGNIKTCLCHSTELFTMSSPSVIVGRDVQRVSFGDNISFLLPFSLSSEQLLVEVSVVPQRNRHPFRRATLQRLKDRTTTPIP